MPGPAATGPGGRPPPSPGRRRRAALLAVSAALAAVPFLAVRYAPLADLPQQAAQVRLLLEALGDPESAYRVQWFAPNTLALAVLALAWAVSTPIAAGRLAMLLLAVAWVAAVHWLAWRRGRPAAAAVLASTLVFSQSLYWGFYSFVLGFPLFAGWLLLSLGGGSADTGAEAGAVSSTGAGAGGAGGGANAGAVDGTGASGAARARDRERAARPWRRAPLWFAAALTLYLAHALWLAAGFVWLALDTALRWRRCPAAAHLARWLGVSPVAALAAWWFGGIGATEFATPAQFADPVWERLRPDHLAGAAFGGLRGPVEPLLLALLLGWLALSVITNRSLRGRGGDGGLAAAGGLLLAGALLLPDKFTGTIHFADRWLPPALALLVLAAPPPRLRRSLLAAVAVAVLAAQTLLTAAVWRRVEAEELSGIDAALAALPAGPRVIGLHLGPASRYLRSGPLGHAFAYAQALRGGELNFSFAELPSSAVVYRRPREVPWTRWLELVPQRVRRDDFAHFDFALIDASEAMHGEIAGGDVLEPLTGEGRWRLYRVLPPPAAPPGATSPSSAAPAAPPPPAPPAAPPPS